MKRMLKLGLIFMLMLVLGAVALVVYAQAKKKSYDRLRDTKDLKQRMASLAADYTAKRKHVGLIIGLVQAGSEYVQGFGTAGPSNAAPPDARSLYEIGSITKVFTAITLAQAAEDGLLKLDDPISKYLPADVVLPQGEAREITFAHLATHSSGLPRLPKDFFSVVGESHNPYILYRASHLYNALRKIEITDVGKDVDYSNFGFGLLGHLLELRARKSYANLVREKLLVPLDMTNTAINLSPEQKARLVPGFGPKGKPAQNWDFDVMAGAGTLRSTAEDMLKFLKANLKPDASPRAAALRQCQKRRFKNSADECGLGWQIVNTLEGLKIYWHNGGTAGYYSFAAFDPKHKTAVVLLSNYGDAFANDHSIDKIGLEILKLASKVSLQPQ